MQEAGINTLAEAEGRIAREKEDYLRQSVSEQQQVLSDLRDNLSAFTNENNEIANAYAEERIDPMAVWHDKSVPSKISTVVGLILGGIGGGLTRQENPAMKFLQYQIDKSVEAQKMRLGRYPTLLQNNLNKSVNMRQAMETTRAQIAEITIKQLEQAAMASGDEVAKAKAMIDIGKLKQSMMAGPLMNSAILGMAYSPSISESQLDALINQAKAFAPDLAKDLEAHRVPGYGVSNKTMDLEASKRLEGQKNFLGRAEELLKLREGHPLITAMRLPGETKAEIQSRAESLLADLARVHGSELSEGDREWLKGQMGNPIGLWDNLSLFENQQRLKTIIGEVRDRQRTLLGQYYNPDRVEGLLGKQQLPSASRAPAPTQQVEQAKKSSGFKSVR